jgi:hypothetical protein
MRGTGPNALWLAAVLTCAGACSSLLGINEPNVVGDDGGNPALEGGSTDHGSIPGDGAPSNDAVASPEGSSSGEGGGPIDSGGGDVQVLDTGVHDTGAHDVSSTDTGTGTDGSVGPCSGGILCDTFEEGTIDSTKWPSVAQTGATAVVDTQNAHSGTHALHVHVDAVPSGSTYDALLENDSIALPPVVYSRFWVLLPGTLPAQSTSYVGYIEGTSPYYGINLGTIGSHPQLTDFGSPSSLLTSTSNVSLANWMCIQTTIDTTSGSTGNITISFGGSVVSDLTSSGVWTGPIGQFHVGAWVPASAPQSAFDVWIDDVYLDSAPVGCNSP